ncbi:MAG: prenyltransferase/squalene oxidase repeat-containing protein, partial [Opitutales bacterium]
QETDGKGKRRRLGYFKEGRLDGPFAAWYPNGVKTMEGSFVEGRMHSASGWKPDGEKCSVTKVENGNGVWLRYDVTAYDKQKWRPVQLVKFHEDGETVMEIEDYPLADMLTLPFSPMAEGPPADSLPRTIISISQGSDGPLLYLVRDALQIPLEDLSQIRSSPADRICAVLQNPDDPDPKYYVGSWASMRIYLDQVSEKVSYFPAQEVLLWADRHVPYGLLKEVFREVIDGGHADVLIGVTNEYGNWSAELPIPFYGKLDANLKSMPQYQVDISETGEVHLNGAWIGDTDSETGMDSLILALKDEQKLREELIASGAKTKQEAEFFVQIGCAPASEHQQFVTVLNACATAGVKQATPFPPLSSRLTTQKTKVKLVKRQKNVPSPTLTQPRAIAISDLQMPDLSNLSVENLTPVVATPGLSIGSTGSNDGLKNALKSLGLALPIPMKSRCDPQARINRLKDGGGKAATEEVIKKGLDWLKATQAKDGSWGANDKDAKGQLKPSDKNAMTGMALLCFLGHCELQDSPKYGNTVNKAIEFLISTPPEDRGIAQGNRGCYSHPIRTYALCEAFTMTKIKKLEPFAKRAAAAVIKGQNESGGWAYGYAKGPTAHIDLSVTSWNIQALKAAALTGILIEGLDVAMDKAVAYVKRCQDSDGRFKYREERHGEHSVHGSLTGAGVLSLQIWKNAKSAEAAKGLEWIINNLKNEKEWSKVNVYAWYYHAQACFQATAFAGG